MSRFSKPLRKKWFRHVGEFRLVKTKSGEYRLKCNGPEYAAISDSHIKDVFIWLGRYLALKNKLPRHIRLEEIAVGSQRTTKAIQQTIGVEMYQLFAKKRGRK